MPTKKLLSNSEVADEMIDPRVLNTLRDYIQELEGNIKGEVTKAGYILGFQGTILFVASTKIGNIENLMPRVFLMTSFLISAFLSFLVITSSSNLTHIDLLDKTTFNRTTALPQLQKNYKKLKKIYTKKVLFNNINIAVQILMLISILLILLFATEIKRFFL